MTETRQGKLTLKLTGPQGVTLELDRREVFPDDPGNGTPALVHYRGGTSTYTCATNEGTVMDNGRNGGEIELPRDVMKWLDDMGELIDQFCYEND